MSQPMRRMAAFRRVPRTASQHGFTLLELMAVLSILAILLATGVPYMSAWIYTNKVASAAQYYAEGINMARNQALTHNSASRLVLTANANNQWDWQVDICFPRPEDACTATSANWSTTTAAAARDPEGATVGFRSIRRSASKLLPAAQLAPTFLPAAARTVHFTPVGWVDTTIGTPIQRITLTPTGARATTVPPVAVALTLAGVASRCKPNVSHPDLQRCPQ